MKILIIGLGSIGKRHFENVRALRPDAEILVYDPERGLGNEGMLANLKHISAAIIASPTGTHFEYLDLLAHGDRKSTRLNSSH